MAPFKSLAVIEQPHRGRGQPSLYRSEYCEAVIEQARRYGTSLPAFAGVVGVSVETVYEWRRRHSEFSEACARAKAARMLWWELKLGRSRKGAETAASMFALRNIAPDEWRDVRSVQHDHKVTADKLTDAELHALIRQKAEAEGITIDAEYWKSERDGTR